ncbi:hypothetical protein [Hyphomicrobium sp.]|jgi:CheY-like chemotaxis protein|uniref:hypothetical protein n=1 Tax=Hyphomicrobium sp. TaxID=82 RepID=UPI002D091377|nr:hypothetical protein [Hyphomicrobium sp.]HVZ05813.1 hypothetical protein [Hyphomicrobium sp.]
MSSIVIVDRSFASGYGMREALLHAGNSVHVFSSYSAALTLLEHKKIDTVVVEFDNDRPTTEFCDAVRRLNIPIVYSAPPVSADDLRQFGFRRNVPKHYPTPTIFLPFRPARAGYSARAL